jgi:hypothetical protein
MGVSSCCFGLWVCGILLLYSWILLLVVKREEKNKRRNNPNYHVGTVQSNGGSTNAQFAFMMYSC